jgi:hypothetical protein
VVALRTDELDEMRKAIADGKLPPDALEKYYEEEAKAVFGHNYKTDRDGKPIEQGIGSASQPSANSVAAYEAYCKHEPDFAANLARMKANLAKYQAKLKAAAGV